MEQGVARLIEIMVHSCSVPDCHNDSVKNPDVSFHRLPLKRKKILKIWINKIGRKNLPLNVNTRVCSDHFVNSVGRRMNFQ